MADRSGYIGRAPGDSSVIIARQTFNPTGVQTDFTFTSGYTVGYLDVYINGARQINASDYTASDGSTVGLTTYATSGDVLELVAYKAFNITNPISNTSGGNLVVGGDLTVTGTSNVGVVTGGTYYGDGSNLTGITTAAVPGINTERHSVFNTINASGIVTAASFSGDGSSLSGVDVAGVSTTGHSVFNTINASGIVTAGAISASNISIPDSGKFTCGDGDDLELYHSGSDSYIRDVGTGDLVIQANSLQMSNTSGTNYLHGTASAEVSLYHNGNVKLATNSGGVTVTGTVTTDQVTSGISTFTGAISANGGIDFSGAQTNLAGMTSELLDHYEEGTWTPTMGYATSYGTQSGKYVKVGKTVHVWFEIEVTAFSATTASTSITSIPFIIDKVTGCWAAVINGVSTTPDWRIGPWAAGNAGLGVWMAGGGGGASASPILMTETSWSNYSSVTTSLGTAFTMRGGWTYISTT